MVFQLKDLRSFAKITPKVLIGHLQVLNDHILDRYKNEY
jgi:hypothetical protein